MLKLHKQPIENILFILHLMSIPYILMLTGKWETQKQTGK